MFPATGVAATLVEHPINTHDLVIYAIEPRAFTVSSGILSNIFKSMLAVDGSLSLLP
jgi:hypothetical protein